MRPREIPSNRFEKQPRKRSGCLDRTRWLCNYHGTGRPVPGIFGRAALVGLTAGSMTVLPYTEIINKEAEIIGVSDHLAAELSALMQLACRGKLSFRDTLRFVDLDAAQINAALDAVENSTDHIRTVIVPRF